MLQWVVTEGVVNFEINPLTVFILGIDEDLVIPDKTLSVYEGAIAPWRGERMSEYKEWFMNEAPNFDFPIHRPWFELSEGQ